MTSISSNNYKIQVTSHTTIEIIGSDQGIRPLKHKAYDQWFWGDWTNGRPIGKGILYSQNGNKKIFYEGDFNGEPNGKGRVIYNEGEY